jgi:hypothetical protein
MAVPLPDCWTQVAAPPRRCRGGGAPMKERLAHYLFSNILDSSFDAFSSREPASTSLENAMFSPS